MSQTSAQLKLAWGVKRIEELSRETLTFEHSHAYVPRIERERRSPYEVEYRVFAVERQSPSSDWPLMAGEAIQSLRAALDHAVFAAAKGKGRTQFPIFTDRCEFQVKGRPLIRRVPAPIRARIEAAQPYEHLPERPALDNLAILAHLSNLDKHRTLTTVACAVDLASVGVESHIELTWRKYPFIHEVLSHDAEIKSFVATSNTEIEDVDVQPSFTYEVRMEGRPLVSTLVAIAKRVFEVVKECETGETISPFEQGYPIQQPLPGFHLDRTPIRVPPKH